MRIRKCHLAFNPPHLEDFQMIILYYFIISMYLLEKGQSAFISAICNAFVRSVKIRNIHSFHVCLSNPQ